MLPQEIINLRLSNQILLDKKFSAPSEVVAHMCAMQAQDFLGSLWAIALRTKSCTESDIENAIANKEIVRSWPMRGTLNFTAPVDLKWMLKLMATRILSLQSKRMQRDFELDETVLNKCRNILIHALQGGKQLARSNVYKVLEEGGVPATQQRGLHIIWNLAQQGLLCFGPRQGKQPGFVLLDEWIPDSRVLSHEESLAEIAYRYYNSRGPATLADFIWWTGLTTSQAKTALELAKPKLISITFEETQYWFSENTKPAPLAKHYLLLPPFDEYLIAYANRSLMLGKYNIKDIVPFSNGMFFPVVVEKGMIIGTWKRTIQSKGVNIDLKPFSPLTKTQEKEIEKVSRLYEHFLQ